VLRKNSSRLSPQRMLQTAVSAAAPKGRRVRAPAFTALATASKTISLSELQGQVRRAGMDQQRLSLRARSTTRRQHAEQQKRGEPRKGRLADADFLGSRQGRVRSGAARPTSWTVARKAAPTCGLLLDESGERRPPLRARPHRTCFIIDPQGKLIMQAVFDSTRPDKGKFRGDAVMSRRAQ